MLKNTGLRVFLAVATIVATPLCAQSVISAKAGLVHYVDGDVFINDKAVEMKPSVYTDVVGIDQVLKTGEEGRAEVLLTPGAFLRLAESSSFKMLANQLSNVRVEILSGTALLEVGELPKENAITVVYKSNTVALQKKGLYRLETATGLLRVYDGEAVVSRDGSTYTVKQSKFVNLDSSVMTAEKFDSKVGDEFYRWASRRANSLSMANIASAKQMYDSGYTAGYGYGSGYGGWVYNPWYGSYTYMPLTGYYTSPFGYGFFSPAQVYGYFNPGYGYGYGGNYGSGYTNGGGSTVATGTHYDSSVGYNVGSRASAPVSSGSYSGGSMPSGGSSAGASAGGGGSARGGGSSAGGASSSGGGRGR